MAGLPSLTKCEMIIQRSRQQSAAPTPAFSPLEADNMLGSPGFGARLLCVSSAHMNILSPHPSHRSRRAIAKTRETAQKDAALIQKRGTCASLQSNGGAKPPRTHRRGGPLGGLSIWVTKAQLFCPLSPSTPREPRSA